MYYFLRSTVLRVLEFRIYEGAFPYSVEFGAKILNYKENLFLEVKFFLLQCFVTTTLPDNSIYYIHVSKVTLLCTNQHAAICFLRS